MIADTLGGLAKSLAFQLAELDTAEGEAVRQVEILEGRAKDASYQATAAAETRDRIRSLRADLRALLKDADNALSGAEWGDP